MTPLRALLILPMLLLWAAPARACWQSPTAACFQDLWQDQTLAYHAQGPKVERLIDLINWGVVPPGEDTATALLQDTSYADLVAFEAAQAAPEDTASESETQHALRLLLGLTTSAAPPEVNTDTLLEVYLLARRTGDQAQAAEWYQHLPDYIQSLPEVPSPDGSVQYPDPYVIAQTKVLEVLTLLRDGRAEDAATEAKDMSGEAGFVVWLALARLAIDTQDTSLLTRAVNGLNASLVSKPLPPFAQEALERALRAAEAEFNQTGDPDAIVHALEASNPTAYVLPIGARITAALAQRHLANVTGIPTQDDFDDALAAMSEALQTRADEDDATPMLNARTALRLGLTDEADQLIAMVDAQFPGVAGFFLYDMPATPEPWANAWLDRMITRFDTIAATPQDYEMREYWPIWLDQDALGAAIDITQRLALYDRRDDAQAFADRAQAYLAQLPQLYPGSIGVDLARIFEGETAAYLYPPDVAIPRMRALGMDATLMEYAFAQSGRPVLALKLVAGDQGYRSLDHWIKQTPEVPDYLRDDYTNLLKTLIEAEPARLIDQGYPDLAQSLHVEAAGFYASLGDWPAAQRHYGQITDVQGTYGPTPAARNQLLILRDIAKLLSDTPTPVQYPYEDFAL